MKNLLILILSLYLLFALPLSVYATEESAASSTTITAQTQTINQPDFTVTLPSSISSPSAIDRTDESIYHDISFSVSIADVQYLNDKEVQISVAPKTGEFLLYCGDSSVPYALYKKNSASEGGDLLLSSGDLFAAFNKNSTATEQEGFIRIDSYDIRIGGSYGAVLTFTIRTVDLESAEE